MKSVPCGMFMISIPLFILTLIQFCGISHASCAALNYCNGHGDCVESTSSCECYDGYGSESDITDYRSPSCNTRVCPSGKAWADVPTASDTAHALAECSNRGICDRGSGECTCFDGFTGDACQRMECPNDCSGHGRCLSMRQMAQLSEALPLSDVTTYDGEEDTVTWDEDMIYGCVCDSSWEVGLASGETQTPEWFGPDCSLRHCPSGDDPVTTADETNCWNVTAAGGRGTGAEGNLCHVDCSNRGLCDYETGLCSCFIGHYGHNCALLSVYATSSDEL
mmetsp:Transcript_4462/g.5785  ORF Transcript_4462/g.5785 Transcript_4462/m.5785 type:complete len:279 (+) Transcript_4462:229-1065(+)